MGKSLVFEVSYFKCITSKHVKGVVEKPPGIGAAYYRLSLPNTVMSFANRLLRSETQVLKKILGFLPVPPP